MLVQQLINGISVGGIYALLATGYALIYSLLGFSNWAHGEVAMLGAYVGIAAVTGAHMPMWLAVIISVIIAGLASVANERLAYRRIRNNQSPIMFLMIAAMGLSTIYQNAVMLIAGPKFLAYPQVLSSNTIVVGGISIGILDLVSTIVAIIAIILLDLLIYHTKFGLAVRASASNMMTASILGVNVDKYISFAFLLSGALAGIAGVMLGMKYTVNPTMGNIALKAFVSSVLGGLGSVRGAIIGAFALGIVEVYVTMFNSGLRDLITFGLLIAILIIRPTGLMGKMIEDKA